MHSRRRIDPSQGATVALKSISRQHFKPAKGVLGKHRQAGPSDQKKSPLLSRPGRGRGLREAIWRKSQFNMYICNSMLLSSE